MATVKRRGDRWQATVRGLDGQERTKTFAKKGDADAWADTNEADKVRGSWVDPRRARMRFRDFVDEEYRPTMVGLHPTTRVRDESYLRTHILPTFGDRELATIDFSMCQRWVTELASRKAPATTVKAAQILNKILAAAVKDKRLPHNPMDGVKRPPIEESEDVYMTPAQVAELADAMESVAPRYRALVMVGCYCGLRIGELAALRWTDVDLLHRTLTVTRKVVEVSGEGMVEGSTKTKAGRRVVTVPRLVAAELERHRAAFPSEHLVFPAAAGGHLRANLLRQRQWKAAVVKLGLDPAPTFHDMRHTAVSLWIAAGASDLEVAKWAGHRSVSFTKDRYAHLFPEHGAALADRLDSFIETATATPAAVVNLRGR